MIFDMDTKLVFKRNLDKLCQNKDYSKLKLAKFLKVQQPQISNWLHPKKSMPSWYYIDKIAEFFGLLGHDLFKPEIEDVLKALPDKQDDLDQAFKKVANALGYRVEKL